MTRMSASRCKPLFKRLNLQWGKSNYDWDKWEMTFCSVFLINFCGWSQWGRRGGRGSEDGDTSISLWHFEALLSRISAFSDKYSQTPPHTFWNSNPASPIQLFESEQYLATPIRSVGRSDATVRPQLRSCTHALKVHWLDLAPSSCGSFRAKPDAY